MQEEAFEPPVNKEIINKSGIIKRYLKERSSAK